MLENPSLHISSLLVKLSQVTLTNYLCILIPNISNWIASNSLKSHLERGLLLHYYSHIHLNSMLTKDLKTFDTGVVYALGVIRICIYQDTYFINDL